MSALVLQRIANNLARLHLTRAQPLVEPLAQEAQRRHESSLACLDRRLHTARQENVIFLGPPGVGKTHLAIALAMKASLASLSISCTTMAALIEPLKRDANSSLKVLGYARGALVVVDEVGSTPISRQEAPLVVQCISWRYERASTVITSNKSLTEWEEMFGDPVIASAMLDRLLHHCRVINIKGNSYRLKAYKEQHSVG